MSEEVPNEESASKKQQTLVKYVPEKDYASIGYKAIGIPKDDICTRCKDYYKEIHSLGLTKKEFPPNCKGHVLEGSDFITANDFELPEDYETFKIAIDPVAWAYRYFGWEARFYQEEMMSCTALMKVARCGRRTGKTTAIVILIMWMLSTNRDYSVLVIAPYEAQVTKIFDEITKFLQMSPELSSSIKRQTKSPNRIEFMNGSKALGFSSGSKSAARSDKVRGQDANFIVLDEADYLDEQDIDAILAILASHPDCGLWASSTPTGKHSKFYQWCRIKDLGFKEFWYISPEAPNWTQDVEDFFKTSVDSVTYDHEYNAEFGIQISGVFRNDLVDRALLHYSLPRLRTPGSKICFGVDWNGQSVGTHIIVTEAVLDGANNFKYVVLDRKVIKGGSFTQHKAVEEIIALNEQYQPEYIYVDSGYGETQVEMLHKYGKENPGSKLHKNVKPYVMGSSIEIRDPHTKQTVTKPAKPFMVNNAVLQLEQDRVVLPTSEDTQLLVDSTDSKESGSDQGLVQQMRNFSIERFSVTGLPTYSQGDEHALTAWMLSLCAFSLEISDLRGHIKHMPPRIIESFEELQKGQAVTEQGKMLAEAARRIGLDEGSKEDQKEKRISIAKGDKNTIKRYYGKKGIDRTSKVNRTNWRQGGRGFGKGSEGRGTF